MTATLFSAIPLPADAHPALEDGGVAAPDAGTLNSEDAPVSPPELLESVEPVYPPAALAARRESHVHLELLISERGQVEDARVLESGGPDFDASIVEALQKTRFRPATQNGMPVRSLVRYTHAFVLPALAGTVDAGTPRGSRNYTTVVMGQRPMSAASSFAVQARDFSLRPIGSVQDILRVTPGLVMVQHSGGGKANQYFLRGFDADHGTDIALSIDGVPINMVSHAHGQGFADTNFIIPEVVERVEITKGPYFANQGDFDTAGSVNMVSREAFPGSSFGLGVTDSPGHGLPGVRAVGIASPMLASLQATFAAELSRTNGPFDHPEGWDRYKLFNKLTAHPSANATLSLTEMSYGGDWHGSGQIPARAVAEGLIGPYGSIDPSEGGATERHQLALAYSVKPNDHSDFKALVYLGSYRFNLFSNFTLNLLHAANGDEIEQVDRRTFSGAKVSYRTVRYAGPVRFDTTLGADLRNDDIHNELWETVQRMQQRNLRTNDVHELLGGAYVSEDISPVRWFRFNLGGRADVMSFAVDNLLTVGDSTAPRSGIGGTYQLSPKASAVFTPIEREHAQLELYLNYGHGFHSNDVRGVFSDPAVSPLARAIGEEVGARTRLWEKWDLSAAGFRLDLSNETVWNGDDGTTAVNGPTTRYGLEVESRYELTSWLAADVQLTFTHSQFSTDHQNGGGLALAPKQTWAGGLSARHALGPGLGRAGLRFYGIGDRPATDDGALTAKGFTQVDLHLGYRISWLDLALDAENLLNSAFRAAQFATVSRLANEPALGSAVPAGFTCGREGRRAPGPGRSAGFQGCEDVDYTPAYPLTVRLLATVFFD